MTIWRRPSPCGYQSVWFSPVRLARLALTSDSLWFIEFLSGREAARVWRHPLQNIVRVDDSSAKLLVLKTIDGPIPRPIEEEYRLLFFKLEEFKEWSRTLPQYLGRLGPKSQTLLPATPAPIALAAR